MAKPTKSSKNTLGHRTPIDSSVRGAEIGTDSVGLTQTATVIERHLEMVSIGLTMVGVNTQTYSHMIFHAPPSGAVITALSVNFGSAQTSGGADADTWVWDVQNMSSGVDLSKQACSLSNTTFAATSWRDTPVNNGNSTVKAGDGLNIEFTSSGTPETMQWPMVAIEWTPTSNA